MPNNSKPGTLAARAAIPAALFLIGVCCRSLIAAGDYVIGADVSFLGQTEKNGTIFKDNGQAKPGLQIFKDHGYNWVRLRLFRKPDRLPNDLHYTIAQVIKAKQLGFKFLLDFHYSDTWADPQKQITPRAWESLSHQELVDAVFAYTRDSIAAFREARAMPNMVQIGNEVIGGMLWPDGRLPQHWDNFADLLKAGIRGVDAGRGDAPRPEIMIHIDRGGDLKATRSFYDHCREHKSNLTSSGSLIIRGGTVVPTIYAKTWPSWQTPTKKISFWWKWPTTGGRQSTAIVSRHSRKRLKAKKSFWLKSIRLLSKLLTIWGEAFFGGSPRCRQDQSRAAASLIARKRLAGHKRV